MLRRSSKQPNEADVERKSGESSGSGDRRRIFGGRKPKDRTFNREKTESRRASYDEPPTTPAGPLEDGSHSPSPLPRPRCEQTFGDTAIHSRSASIQGIADMASSPAHRHRDAAPDHEVPTKVDNAAKSPSYVKQEFKDVNIGSDSRNFQALELDQVKDPFEQKFGNTTMGPNSSNLQGAMSADVMKLFWGQPAQTLLNTLTVQHTMSLQRHDEVRDKTQGC